MISTGLLNNPGLIYSIFAIISFLVFLAIQNPLICYRIPRIKNTVDMFPRTDGSKDINAVLSSHVETVVLMSRVDK